MTKKLLLLLAAFAAVCFAGCANFQTKVTNGFAEVKTAVDKTAVEVGAVAADAVGIATTTAKVSGAIVLALSPVQPATTATASAPVAP